MRRRERVQVGDDDRAAKAHPKSQILDPTSFELDDCPEVFMRDGNGTYRRALDSGGSLGPGRQRPRAMTALERVVATLPEQYQEIYWCIDCGEDQGGLTSKELFEMAMQGKHKRTFVLEELEQMGLIRRDESKWRVVHRSEDEWESVLRHPGGTDPGPVGHDPEDAGRGATSG